MHPQLEMILSHICLLLMVIFTNNYTTFITHGMLPAGKGPSAADTKSHEGTALGFQVDRQCVRHNEKIGSDSVLVLLVIVSG